MRITADATLYTCKLQAALSALSSGPKSLLYLFSARELCNFSTRQQPREVAVRQCHVAHLSSRLHKP